MVGLSAELDSMQAGFADCDTVVACCVDTVAVIEGLCDVDRVSGRGDTVGWAVIDGLCNVDMVSGRDDTEGWGVDTKARLEGSWHIDYCEYTPHIHIYIYMHLHPCA